MTVLSGEHAVGDAYVEVVEPGHYAAGDLNGGEMAHQSPEAAEAPVAATCQPADTYCRT